MLFPQAFWNSDELGLNADLFLVSSSEALLFCYPIWLCFRLIDLFIELSY